MKLWRNRDEKTGSLMNTLSLITVVHTNLPTVNGLTWLSRVTFFVMLSFPLTVANTIFL